MSFTYEVETETIRIMQRHKPLAVMVQLWEVVETFEQAAGVQTTTRRLVQSWHLPVDTTPANDRPSDDEGVRV